MRLSKIEFTNFRCFRSEVIEIGQYTSFVGPNNCGKSTVLRALSIFFGGNAKSNSIDTTDFYIECQTVADLSLKFEFVDIDGAPADELGHYVRNGRVSFEIVASRDSTGMVSSFCRGIRFGLPELSPFFAAQSAAERKPIYEQIRGNHPQEISTTWQNMSQALEAIRAYEASRLQDHVAIPSEENAYGATGPIPKLRKYIDWIYVPAVKDASTEASEQRESAFSKLILYAVRSKCNFSDKINEIKIQAANSLQEALNGTDLILKELGGEIDREFRNLTTTPINVSIEWGKLDDIALREPIINSVFKDGQVLRPPEFFGHGLQRTYLMALLSLAAKVQKDDTVFQLLLGIEEPELYQHPPQSRFLANALSDISMGNCQVLITTHSPHFVSGRTFETIRSLRKRNNMTKVHSWTVDSQRNYCAVRKGTAPIGAGAALSGLDRALQTSVSEMFFAGKVIFVEGAEDAAIIEAYLKERGKFLDFLRSGCHLVAVGGKTKMHSLIALARGFQIDVFCIFDFDMNLAPDERANSDIVRYASDAGDMIDISPSGEFRGKRFFGWYENIQRCLEAECAGWKPGKISLAEEWGWSLKKLNKDPMLVAEVISRLVKESGTMPPLERLIATLEVFWSE